MFYDKKKRKCSNDLITFIHTWKKKNYTQNFLSFFFIAFHSQYSLFYPVFKQTINPKITTKKKCKKSARQKVLIWRKVWMSKKERIPFFFQQLYAYYYSSYTSLNSKKKRKNFNSQSFKQKMKKKERWRAVLLKNRENNLAILYWFTTYITEQIFFFVYIQKDKQRCYNTHNSTATNYTATQLDTVE